MRAGPASGFVREGRNSSNSSNCSNRHEGGPSQRVCQGSGLARRGGAAVALLMPECVDG